MAPTAIPTTRVSQAVAVWRVPKWRWLTLPCLHSTAHQAAFHRANSSTNPGVHVTHGRCSVQLLDCT
jgi:hypothetical protein